MKKTKDKYFVWVVAYIDSTHLSTVNEELKRYPEYSEVEAYIPTVKVLKKTFKGKREFKEVPLLFNYGFFKLPRKFALNKNYLDWLKRDISCIFGWVRDPISTIRARPKMRLDGESVYGGDDKIEAATVTSEEISNLLKNTFEYSAHSADDLEKVGVGNKVTLHGYPFEGIEAIIKEIDNKKRTVKVEIRIFDQMRETTVSFDNVFFTVYKSFDDSLVYAGYMEGTAEAKFDKKSIKDFKNEEDKP